MSNTRVIEDMPFDEYLGIDALSASALKVLALHTPETLKYQRDNPPPVSAAMIFGSALHTAVLQPELFDDQFAVKREGLDRRTKAGKEEWAELVGSGRQILKAEEFHDVVGMAKRLRANKDLGHRLERGRKELTLVWDREGVRCKARLDLLVDGMIFDIKTTARTTAAGFAADAARLGYDLQAAWYLAGAAQCLSEHRLMWVWVEIEKKEPYIEELNVMAADWMRLADARISAAFDRYRECVRTGKWPGRPSGINELDAPQWAKAQGAVYDEPGI